MARRIPCSGFCPSGVAAGTKTPFATGPNGCQTAVIPRFVENRFGGTFGGPVVKDKVWFFASYQNDRQRGYVVGHLIQPYTDAERNCYTRGGIPR